MINCINISSTTAAILGTIIGGIIGVLGTIITTWATFEKESKSFNRNISQKHIEEVLSVYSFALNVFFNLKSGGIPDRSTNGEVYARISLYGSVKVKNILNEIIQISQNKKKK
jgi:phage-related protein